MTWSGIGGKKGGIGSTVVLVLLGAWLVLRGEDKPRTPSASPSPVADQHASAPRVLTEAEKMAALKGLARAYSYWGNAYFSGGSPTGDKGTLAWRIDQLFRELSLKTVQVNVSVITDKTVKNNPNFYLVSPATGPEIVIRSDGADKTEEVTRVPDEIFVLYVEVLLEETSSEILKEGPESTKLKIEAAISKVVRGFIGDNPLPCRLLVGDPFSGNYYPAF